MSDYEDDFDPNSEVYVQTEFPEDEYAAAEAARQQDQASSVSEDFLRQMDGKGSGGPRAPRRPTGPDGRSTNTGVKGVQADYAAAKLKLRARRLEAKLYAERALNCASVGADRSEVTVAEAPPMPRQKSADELDSDFDSDEDGGAFEAYKMQRMRALQAQQQQADAPFWGKLEEATVQNFIEEVEEAAGSHFIVVHLYQPYVEECVRVNFALMTLAERFPRIRFMRGVCTDLIPSFDEIGLPTLMLYRGGKQLDILVRITDDLGPNFADRDLVFYLNKHGVISNELVDAFLGVSRAPIASAAAASRAGGARHGRGGNRDDDDEDGSSSSTRKSSGVSAFSYKSASSAAADDFERRSPSKSRSTLTIRRAGKYDDDDY